MKLPRFTLKALFAVVTLAAVAVCVGQCTMRPFNPVARIDCGAGRSIEILEINEFCDPAIPVYYRFTGMKRPEAPHAFDIWPCGEYTNPRPPVLTAEKGALVGVPNYLYPQDIDILVDFSNSVSWPNSWHREVNEDARDMLRRLRRKHSDVWLHDTYDGELTRPRTDL